MKILAVLAIITAISGQAAPQQIGTEYPQGFIVTEVNQESDTITLTTATGYDYIWEGAEDWQEGDQVAAIMNDQGTPSILDDSIICIKYVGF
jgi:hypothetical protein